MPSNSDIHCCSQNVERKRTEESARRRNRLPPVKTNTSTSWMTSFSKTLPETENEHKPAAFILYAKQLRHSLLFVECWEEDDWGISSEKKSFTSGEDEYIDLVDDFFRHCQRQKTNTSWHWDRRRILTHTFLQKTLEMRRLFHKWRSGQQESNRSFKGLWETDESGTNKLHICRRY